MDFDDVLTKVGDFGRYQKWLFILLCIPASFPQAVSIFNHIFISAVPSHHCHAPIEPEQALLLRNSLQSPQDYETVLNTLFLPGDYDGAFEKCRQYDIDINSIVNKLVASQSSGWNVSAVKNFVDGEGWPLTQCHNGWDYDRREYPETLVTKLDVVCDREWLLSTAQSVFFVGGTIGCLLFGWLADRIGRRPSFFIATGMMLVANILDIYPPSYEIHIVYRFFSGLIYPSVYQIAFLIIVEMIGMTRRTASAMAIGTAFSLGMMIFAIIVHFVPHWRALQAVTSLPCLLLIGYYWVVPESPRWLISEGRIDEAEVIVQKIAKVNKVSIPSNYLRMKIEEAPSNDTDIKKPEQKFSAFEIFKYPRVLRKMIVISVVWTITAMVYNGMSFGVPALASEAYIAFFLSGLVEIPGNLSAFITMERFGRKSTLVVTLFVGGILSAATACVPKEISWLSVLLPSLTKLCVSSSFTVIYMFAGELFPTVVRGLAIGIASTTSQLGLIITPYILYLGTLYGDTVPFIILGALSAIGGLLTLTLPETLNTKMPGTLKEAEEFTNSAPKKEAKIVSQEKCEQKQSDG